MGDFDKLLKNCRVLNVRTGGIEKGDIAFKDGLIAAVGGDLGEGEDCGGLFALPGFIDAHVHIESSQLIPSRFAEAIMPCGTTTIIADPHEITNVCGMDGINFMIADAASTPLEVRMMMPSCVPASPAESGGAVLDEHEVAKALARDDIFGLGEMMNYPGVTGGDADVLGKLAAARAAKAGGFDMFATTLTVSPHKNAPLINAVGRAVGEKEGVEFLPSDFKKQDGYLHSIRLSQEFSLYRQNYCGCEFAH